MVISGLLLNVMPMFKCKVPKWNLQNLSLKVMLKNKWVDLVLDTNFMTLTNFSLILFMLLDFIVLLRSPSNHFGKNHQLNVTLSFFFFSKWPLPLLAPFSSICRLYLYWCCQHELLGFINQNVTKIVMIFFCHKNSKLLYGFKSISLKIMQGSGVLHFTIFSLLWIYKFQETTTPLNPCE